MHRGAGDHLLLRQQPGPDLDLAADAERVDPLIAGRRLRARPDHLPVIRRRAASRAAATGCPFGEPDADRAGRRRSDRRRRRPRHREPTAARENSPVAATARRASVRSPDATRSSAPLLSRSARNSRVRARRNRRRQVVRPARRAAAASHASRSRDTRRIDPVRAERHEIEHAVGVDVRHRQRQHGRRRARPRHLAKLACLPILEHVQVALRVEQRRVRIAVAIDVAPREAAQIRRRRQTAAVWRHVPSPLLRRTSGAAPFTPTTRSSRRPFRCPRPRRRSSRPSPPGRRPQPRP